MCVPRRAAETQQHSSGGGKAKRVTDVLVVTLITDVIPVIPSFPYFLPQLHIFDAYIYFYYLIFCCATRDSGIDHAEMLCELCSSRAEPIADSRQQAIGRCSSAHSEAVAIIEQHEQHEMRPAAESEEVAGCRRRVQPSHDSSIAPVLSLRRKSKHNEDVRVAKPVGAHGRPHGHGEGC